jgi:hypothetical protein
MTEVTVIEVINGGLVRSFLIFRPFAIPQFGRQAGIRDRVLRARVELVESAGVPFGS